MYNHLIDFIDVNNILSKHQFGFRKKHSTNHAGIALVDKISTALDMGKVAMVALSISRKLLKLLIILY